MPPGGPSRPLRRAALAACCALLALALAGPAAAEAKVIWVV
jgi:hypothetical protein